MQGKHIVFLSDVTSPVFGNFTPGTVAKNVDAAFAQSMVDAGAAKFTTAGDAQADSDAASAAAGRLSTKTKAEPAQRTEKHFSAADGLPKPDAPATGGAIAPGAPASMKPVETPLATDAKMKIPAPVPPSAARAAPAAKGGAAKTVASAAKAGGGKSAASKAAGKTGAKAK